MTSGIFDDFRYVHDGLELAGRLYGSLDEPRLPLVCLSGLTRNARDFDPLAQAIRDGPESRPVVAFDYRGRGRSDYAAGPDAYTVPAEAEDITAGLDHLGVKRAIFLGTSRGALVIHILAATHLDLIAGAVFNDAGPRIEVEGLRLIRDTVGRIESFSDWDAATDELETTNRPRFPALARADFARMAHALFVERNGRIVGDYDRRLLEPLRAMDLDRDLPELWDLFARLKDTPLLVIRGENSALFTSATVQRMSEMHPGMETYTAAGQGHAPLLETADMPERIARFANGVEERSAQLRS